MKRVSGQVLVLGCVTLLLLALTMMASFTLSSAIHERIRIQSQADAQAYSIATLEARGLNIMVYTNRTIAAVVVTNMSVHAWHTIASETVSILSGAETSMGQVVAKEERCCDLEDEDADPVVRGRSPCCAHAREAQQIQRSFGNEAASWTSLIQGVEPIFNQTVDGLNKAAAGLHVLQQRTLDKVDLEISSPNRGTLKVLQERNAPRSSYLPEVHMINRREFACAVEGWSSDDRCQTLLGMTKAKLSPPARSAIIEDVSNAARGSFHQYCAKGSCEAVGAANFQPNSAWLLGIMGNEGNICLGFDGKAGVTKLAHTLPPQNLWAAESVGAESTGGLMIGWNEGRGSAPLAARAFSDEAGGLHGPGHSGPHTAFQGIQKQDVCQGAQSCFINFRGVDPAIPGKRKDGTEVALSIDGMDRGLPSTWGAVKQDLSLMRGGNRGPWLLNDKGKVEIDLGTPSKAVMRIGAGEAIAVSRGLVYFHELGSPRPMVPNMFDPFFRAKLERFRCRQLIELLSIVGDTKGAELVRDYRSPVEGVAQTEACSSGGP